jgi:hypothetical protein
MDTEFSDKGQQESINYNNEIKKMNQTMYTGNRTFPPLAYNPHMLSQPTPVYTLLLYQVQLTMFNFFLFLYFLHTHASQEKDKHC